ncbi:MAG: DUF4230 domain-containing protein [Saprospiraceae bacterium]|nr:DUF4230 domain-containing protein [Saprospiraceae bacterium]
MAVDILCKERPNVANFGGPTDHPPKPFVRMSNRIVQILLLIVAFALGGWLMYRYLKPSARPVENATVLLEKIRPVLKLTTVEGQFSEIYNYSEYQGYFTFFWDKKALVRVRATVSAGYDLNNLRVEADSLTRTLRIGPLPEPQILSIDHTLDYYDISEGIFTDFSPEDYNRINQKAKDLIRDEAQRSGLLEAARTQAGQMLDLIRFMGEGAGWKVEIVGGGGPLQ